ncbi:MAG: phenylalanine--tRNA ligase subunit beta [Phycisphaerae bacterium]
MLLSLNWLREFVELPRDLDPRLLAERVTVTTAEVEGVEHHTAWPAGMRLPPGAALDAAEQDDWVIEIDNKSITHRPDLWGHYGMARELAAMFGKPLRPLPVTPTAELGDPAAAAVPIVIDDADRCPRYAALVMRGLADRAAPGVMQVRLARCGMRPLGLLVDLTNYVMLEIGQPMHAFDAERLSKIEVALAAPSERFRTLDGVERVLPANTLMIQSNRKSVAIAGIMGGAETEVSARTTAVLLESANFDAATIRRASAALALRTEASARFEKSLDPALALTGIARFVFLARRELPGLSFGSRLSDSFPRPLRVQAIALDAAATRRTIGKEIPTGEMTRLLRSLEFNVQPANGPDALRVTPPTFRATKDISLEIDLVEEIARCVGYGTIESTLPAVTTRYVGQAPALRLERVTLETLCRSGPFAEVHDYIWYDDAWIDRLGFEPGACIVLRNPAAAGSARLRRTLMPGLLAFVERNRHHWPRFSLAEIGSVFSPGNDAVERSQERRVGLAAARSGASQADAVWNDLKDALERWARQVLNAAVRYEESPPAAPWEDATRTAAVHLAMSDAAAASIGRLTLWSLASRQRIDERLRSWSVALAELSLTGLESGLARADRLSPIPGAPPVRVDFSFLADARRRWSQISADLAQFDHPLLRRINFVDCFEGGRVPAGQRSFTVRAELGADRTLSDDDVQQFRSAMTERLSRLGLELRS